ncbi:hypothetical protein GCM10009000_074530 [Halobacterium noricense]|uniref:Helicase HerA central domain-containing protein n=1 Tax=Haladaptatus pallidirubidus TaxID=1008152 RepID=A0AAV3UM14_9EURY
MVGKRGYGKSYTLGVLVEELADAERIAPVVADPMGAFTTFAEVSGFEVISEPCVSAAALSPRAWCELLGLDRESPTGSLVWRAVGESRTLAEMNDYVENTDANRATRRAARNHLALAESWNTFSPDGLTAERCVEPELGVVLDCSGYDSAPMNAVIRAVAEELYRARIAESIGKLPWLVVDEAHTFFGGIADSALRTIITRGRHPGVSLVAATQRPAVLPEVAISQSDLLVIPSANLASRPRCARARSSDLHARVVFRPNAGNSRFCRRRGRCDRKRSRGADSEAAGRARRWKSECE